MIAGVRDEQAIAGTLPGRRSGALGGSPASDMTSRLERFLALEQPRQFERSRGRAAGLQAVLGGYADGVARTGKVHVHVRR